MLKSDHSCTMSITIVRGPALLTSSSVYNVSDQRFHYQPGKAGPTFKATKRPKPAIARVQLMIFFKL